MIVRSARALAIALVLALISISCAPSDALNFENNTPSASGTNDQSNANVAVGTHGEVYVVWQEYDGATAKYIVYFSMSKDGGQGWLASPVEVGRRNGGNGKLAISADANNDVFIAFGDLYDPVFPADDWCVKQLVRHSDGTFSFLYASPTSHGDDNAFSNPDLASGISGGSAFTCLVYMSGGICIRRSDVNSWGTYTTVQAMDENEYWTPRVAVCGSYVAVTYSRNDNDVMLNVDMGSGFSPVPMTIPGFMISTPDVAIYGSELYLVWSYCYNIGTQWYYDINFSHASYTGGSWQFISSALVDDVREARSAEEPSVTVSKEGIVYVCWADSRNVTEYGVDVYYDFTTGNGLAFGVDRKVNRDYSGATHQFSPALDCGYGFGPYVVWEDRRASPYRIKMEDLSNARTDSLSAVYRIGGLELPEFQVNDIVKCEDREYEDETWLYRQSTDSWSRMQPASVPSKRAKHTLAALDGTTQLIMFGGDVSGTLNGETWTYNQGSNIWTNKVPASPPTARKEHALSTIYGYDDALLFGGTDGTSYLQQTWLYDLATNSWAQQSLGLQPPGRAGHAMAPLYGTDMVILYGGYYVVSGTTTYLSDTWLYDRSANAWTNLGLSAPGQKRFHSLATIADSSTQYRYLVLFGGEDATAKYSDTWLFSYDTSSSSGYWQRLAISGPSARIGQSMATIYGTQKVVLHGGEDGVRKGLEDVWVFDKATSAWKKRMNGTAERSFATLASSAGSSDAILFGGLSDYHYSIIAGVGNVSILKYTANVPTLTNKALRSIYGGANCVAKAATIRAGKAVVVGKSTAQGEIWKIDYKDEVSGTATSSAWISNFYSDITEVSYDGTSAATLMMGWYGSGRYLFKVSEDLSSYSEQYLSSYTINAICPRGVSGYYVFAYDDTNKVNCYYTHDGVIANIAQAFAVANGPKGPIMDAYSVVVDPAGPLIHTYLAASSYQSASTRGLYRMVASGSPATYSMVEMNVNGDCDTTYFNYSAIDVRTDKATNPEKVTVIAAGSNSYPTMLPGGKKTGVYVKFEEKLVGGSWAIDTLDFESTRKNEFCATQMLDSPFFHGNTALVGGVCSSPGLFFIGGDINTEANITGEAGNAPAVVHEAKITVPGDDPNIINRMNEQFIPSGTNKIEFWVNVSDDNGLADIEVVKFQAWYDDPDGDGMEETWNDVTVNTDRNARVEIICTRTGGTGTGTYTFSLSFPTSEEVGFNALDCTASESGINVSLKFVFSPRKQIRYAKSGSFNSGSSDVSTWNFQYECTDGGVVRAPVGGASGDGWEFGIERVVSLDGVMGRTIGDEQGIIPGEYGTTGNFSIVWSANNDYRLSVKMSTALVMGTYSIAPDNVMVCEPFMETDGFPGNDFHSENKLSLDNYTAFGAILKSVYWYGNSNAFWDAPTFGYEQSFDTNLLAYIPPGTKTGTYSATLTYSLEIDDQPCTPRVLSGSPVSILQGESAGDRLGTSVASCDVNNDGFGDVIVGAPGYGANNRGRVYVYNGSARGLELASPQIFDGENDNDFFGAVVACAGDVNNDGFDDVLVGASAYSANKGRVYLYKGSAAGLTLMQTIDGTSAGERFGYSLACAGDVNGDGFDDVVVGAPYNSDNSVNSGKVYYYNGSATGLDATRCMSTTGFAASDLLGYAVSSAGDINADGYDDILIGSPGYNGGTYTGLLCVCLGNASGPMYVGAIAGSAVGIAFGSAVSPAGDVNGDGFDDVMVSAVSYSGDAGAVYIYNGLATWLDTTPSRTLTGEGGGDMFGSVLAPFAFDGNGYGDVIVGAYNWPGDNQQGRVYVYCGASSGIGASVAWSATGEASSDMFGISIAGSSDINGDGYADLVVGAGMYGVGDEGRVYVYL